MKQPITKISNIITKVIKEINVTAEYSKWQKLLLVALRYTYYPCSRLFLSSMRKRKARIIFEEVDKFNKVYYGLFRKYLNLKTWESSFM